MKSAFEKLSWLQENKASKILRYIGYCVSAIVVFIIAFFIYGQFFTTSHRLFGGEANEFNTGWIYADPDNTESIQYVTLPISIDEKNQERVEIGKTLSTTINDLQYLCILNRWDLDVYVGDTLRYDHEKDKDELKSGYVKSHFILIPIYPSDCGKRINLVMNVNGVKTADFNAIYYGSAVGIFYKLISLYGPQAIAAMALFVISIMIMVSSYILLFVYRRKMPIILLTYGTTLAALWFIFDSFLYQVLFSNYYVDGPMEYMLILLFPYYFVRYLNFEQKRRYEILYSITSLFMIINFIVMTYLHFSCIRPFEKNLVFTSMNAVICILVFLVTIVRDILKGYVKEYPLVAAGFSMIIIFGIVQVIVINVSVDNHDALYVLAGVYLLLLFALLHMIRQLRAVEDVSRRQKQANELKSSFLANMSHEIRTPLNAILGMNEMIYQESTDKEIKQYSTNIHSAGNTLLDIINDILDFSKIESGKMVLVNCEYSLKDMLTNLYNMLSIKAIDKDLKLIIDLDPTIPYKLYGDENRVKQVLINLLNNAIKYTEKGSVTFKITVDEIVNNVETDSKVANLRFAVIDTGIGIKDEDRDKLFTTFERIDVKRNRSIEGTGLGLSITNNLVNLMDGQLTVDSVYGEGSVFTAVIPQKVTGDEAIGDFETILKADTKDNSQKRQEYTTKDVRILVVDDVKMNIRVVKGLLKKHGVEIVEALSGAECIEKYAENDYDLLLLDHMMPEMDGIETLKAMKEKYTELCPIVVLTANAISGMKEMYLSEGFDDYLAKPTKPDELDEIILKYVKAEKIEMR